MLYKTCYCELKSSKSICKYALSTPLLVYISVRNVHKGDMGVVHFLQNKQEDYIVIDMEFVKISVPYLSEWKPGRLFPINDF